MADEQSNNPGQDENAEGQDQQISIELDQEVAEGIYSNLAMIAHSPSEFVVDFIRMMPGTPKANVKSRIIITPEHAVRFLNALKENIERYESQHGPIKKTENPPKLPMTFGGTMGQA